MRFRRDGAWSAWRPLPAGEIHPAGRVASELVAAGRAGAYQVRAPQGARDVRAVAINTTDGRRERVSEPPATARAARAIGLAGRDSRSCYLSRALWGADESLRRDAGGQPEFFPAQRLTVHHTATDTGIEAGEVDPAAVVRAIYRYHVVDLGFDDIGYQLLVDQRGCVYEGRYSGPDPLPVYKLPTSLGPLEAVNGAHTADSSGGETIGYNAGNVGIALLGNFNEVEPSPPALRSLTTTLAALSIVSGLDPEGYGTYVNPVTGVTKDTHVISGHRDWLATECPGEQLYARLPELRENAASLLAGINASSPLAHRAP